MLGHPLLCARWLRPSLSDLDLGTLAHRVRDCRRGSACRLGHRHWRRSSTRLQSNTRARTRIYRRSANAPPGCAARAPQWSTRQATGAHGPSQVACGAATGYSSDLSVARRSAASEESEGAGLLAHGSLRRSGQQIIQLATSYSHQHVRWRRRAASGSPRSGQADWINHGRVCRSLFGPFPRTEQTPKRVACSYAQGWQVHPFALPAWRTPRSLAAKLHSFHAGPAEPGVDAMVHRMCMLRIARITRICWLPSRPRGSRHNVQWRASSWTPPLAGCAVGEILDGETCLWTRLLLLMPGDTPCRGNDIHNRLVLLSTARALCLLGQIQIPWEVGARMPASAEPARTPRVHLCTSTPAPRPARGWHATH